LLCTGLLFLIVKQSNPQVNDDFAKDKGRWQMEVRVCFPLPSLTLRKHLGASYYFSFHVNLQKKGGNEKPNNSGRNPPN
jgi:hypothetical protein